MNVYSSNVTIYFISSTVPECIQECQNGGMCVDGICVCMGDYVGPYCQFSSKLKLKSDENISYKNINIVNLV